MVLGSKVQGLTYPKSVYYSTSPYGFFYIRHALAMPPRLWTEEDDKWLASLYGLTFEKKVRPHGLDENAAWDDYIQRVEAYLKKGFPVQTFFGWTPKGEAESRGEIVTPAGLRAYWWEGLTRQNRPDTHSFVIVGLDRPNNQVRMNIPMGGWSGIEKYCTRPLSFLRKRIEPLRSDLKYVTIAYMKTDGVPKDEKTIQKLVKERAQKKVEGDPSAYVKNPPERHLYGVATLRALRSDLEPAAFFKILAERTKRQNVSPVEILVLFKLALDQHIFMTSLAAEHPEEERMTAEWEWISKLNVLYHKLYISNMKLLSTLRETEDKKIVAQKCEPVLKEMRGTVDELIGHFEKRIKTKAT